MYRHQSIAQVVAELDLVLPDEVNPDIATSALTQARQRPGQEPFAQLFALSALAWDTGHQRGQSWRGLARYAMDGSALRTSDTAGNRGHLGIWAFGHPGVRIGPRRQLSANAHAHVDVLGNTPAQRCRAWRVRQERGCAMPKSGLTPFPSTL